MKNMRRSIATVLCTAFFGLAGAALQAQAGEDRDRDAMSTTEIDPVIQWNRNLLVLVRTPGVQPATMHATRSFAMMHVAIFDAVNAIDRRHRPFLVRFDGPHHDASIDAAVDSAAHEVLVALYPTQQALLDADFTASLALIPDGPDKTAGIAIGGNIADQVVVLRNNDGANAPPIPYKFGTAPGDYQSTPLNFPPQPQLTQWSQVTPFAIERANQFRPGPPPGLTSDAYTAAFLQVASLGMDGSTTATADQQQIGLFWNGAIQNYWNEIAQTASIAHHLTTSENAALFARLNVTLADTVIAFYDAKYTYNRWRPVTAIRLADTDGNPATPANATWLPEGKKNTAPDPSYPGAHASISAAAAEVLASFFRNDAINLKVTSEVLPGVVRSFSSFSGAFDEASLSRVLAGQHFSYDEDAGKQLGIRVADFVDDHFFARRGRDDRDDN